MSQEKKLRARLRQAERDWPLGTHVACDSWGHPGPDVVVGYRRPTRPGRDVELIVRTPRGVPIPLPVSKARRVDDEAADSL